MPGRSQSHHGLGCQNRTELRHRSILQRAPAQMGILHMCSRTGQVAWNCQHQNNGCGIWCHCSPVYWQPPGQDGWTEKGTKHLYSRTEVTGLLHSSSPQHNFYNNLNKLSSLLKPSNQTACGIKRLKKTSYIVTPSCWRAFQYKGAEVLKNRPLPQELIHAVHVTVLESLCQDQNRSKLSWWLKGRAVRAMEDSL